MIGMQALLFDLYGTLVDEIPAYKRFLQLNLGLKDDADSFIGKWFVQQRKIVFGGEYMTFREVMRDSLKLAAEKDRIPVPAGLENEDFIEIFSNIKPFPEVPSALSALKKKLRLGVLTNSDSYMLAKVLPKLGVRMDMVLSAESIRSYKPNRKNYQAALDGFAVPLPEILFVSGTPWDVKTAGDLGFTVAFIERNASHSEPEPMAKYVVRDLTELVKIITSVD